ncbi:MAG: branched-chain amino acid ABC transporter permease [Spirochaetota bacterium]|nr:branched-chain amino acid ABC transporter permease [Spirochaetota bacterium]
MLEFILLLIIYIGIYSILSLSLNLIAGYTGLLSLCHAAFMAIGTYTTAIIMVNYDCNLIIALLISGVFASLFGVLIGIPTLRLKGDYLAIATLGFGEIVRNILLNWDDFTGGPMGISGIPSPKLLWFRLDSSSKIQYVILIWIFVFITYWVIRRLISSRFGRALEAIREDEIAALAMGINITKYKIFSFTIGAFFAGIAGSLWAVYNQTVTPATFTFILSVMILCMVVLGGMGNHIAVVLGAIIVVLSSEFPRLMGFSHIIPPQINQLMFGLILVIMMIYRPQGILGREKPDFEKILRRRLNKRH